MSRPSHVKLGSDTHVLGLLHLFLLVSVLLLLLGLVFLLVLCRCLGMCADR
jgi:hypothetical protein